MIPELQEIIDDPVIKDLSHKLTADVTRKAAETSSLVRGHLERAFIVLHAASCLMEIGVALLVRHFGTDPETAYRVARTYVDTFKKDSIESSTKISKEESEGPTKSDIVNAILRAAMTGVR